MERIATAASTTNAYKIALETHTTRASNGKSLLFVWDLVATDADFKAMKYILDAANGPLRSHTTKFEEIHGLSRYLEIRTMKKRVPLEMNMFEGLY